VSKSEREARTLIELDRAGVRVPAVLAYGEDGTGRAFVLLAAVPGARDLRSFLRTEQQAPRGDRRAFARKLGKALARAHAAGFDHPDLVSKHVLVHPLRRSVTLIDWPRARRRRTVGWARRMRDLALLHASLADDLASPNERFTCLRAYLRAAGDYPPVTRLLRMLRARAAKLRHRRSFRELRQPPLPTARQRLIWVEGEALCVTRDFWRACEGRLPDWLTRAARETVNRRHTTPFALPGGRALLTRGPAARWWQAWLARLRGRRYTSPELRRAELIGRLRRFGVPVPRLLAFGQRPDGAAFLLTEQPDAIPLRGDLPVRLHAATLALLRRLAAAGLRLRRPPAGLSVRAVTPGDRPAGASPSRPHRLGGAELVLTDLSQLKPCSRVRPFRGRA
jgi:tRNA A-37 threonylcarbamoyl transferase component Bud32